MDSTRTRLIEGWLEVAQLGTWSLHLKTETAVLSERFLETLGREPHEFDGTFSTLLSWIHPEDRGDFEKAMEYHIQDGIPFDVRIRILDQSGDSHAFESRATAIRDTDGNAEFMAGILTGQGLGNHQDADIHALLADHQRMLMQSARMSALGEMAGGVAHEINNPLAIIKGKASLLLRSIEKGGLEPEKLSNGLEIIESMTLRIAKIVKGLRSFSRNAENDPFQEAKVNDLLEDTFELCKERMKNHEIDFRTPTCPDLTVECRPPQISEVLLNLLNNAHDAVATLPEKWIQVDVKDEGDFVRLSVTDSGPGITPAIADKMMQPFFTTKEIGKGTGLGLPIAKGIMEIHQGSLELERNCPNTQFTIRLPKKRHP